eukprot:4508619-Lingulodinium_polyedra.AAC.1
MRSPPSCSGSAAACRFFALPRLCPPSPWCPSARSGGAGRPLQEPACRPRVLAWPADAMGHLPH